MRNNTPRLAQRHWGRNKHTTLGKESSTTLHYWLPQQVSKLTAHPLTILEVQSSNPGGGRISLYPSKTQLDRRIHSKRRRIHFTTIPRGSTPTSPLSPRSTKKRRGNQLKTNHRQQLEDNSRGPYLPHRLNTRLAFQRSMVRVPVTPRCLPRLLYSFPLSCILLFSISRCRVCSKTILILLRPSLTRVNANYITHPDLS